MPNNPKPLLLNQGGVPVYPVTDASLVMNLSGPEIFWAVYGTTTYAGIVAAFNAGKKVVCLYDEKVYDLTYIVGSYAGFSAYWDKYAYLVKVSSSDVWSAETNSLQSTYDRVNTLAGYESNAQRYPSTKATYDAIHPAVETTQPAGGFAPNIVYDLGELTGTVTFALATPADANIANAYYWTFSTGSTAPTITWPANLSWAGGSAPTIAANKKYEIMIRNGCASALEF